MTTENPYANTIHNDSSVTYWSVYEQHWVEHARYVPDREMAAWSELERHAWSVVAARRELAEMANRVKEVTT